ncbi:hypothetical protein FOYG_05216 [Fusarium oxysporum NRRL 32931]|uniref:Uncharacterized protein n=1 Tax=Fusarium oxysporum NRRL 32931 TaxID=660029 RepID=W9IVK9_FUSOX|nr:hypothetical protein FOYG_05216 [Fusarium oxysporum NRRL 32931]
MVIVRLWGWDWNRFRIVKNMYDYLTTHDRWSASAWGS